jgi:glycosyltransferase involved in cell wall biosynthesis
MVTMQMRPHPKISVVVTCFNYGRFLRRALDSIRRQSERDWELIVVDDGSTDDSWQVAHGFAEAYQDLAVSLLRTRNGGLSRARNQGIAIARGRYVTCLDADDHFASTALERMASVLDADPTVGVARPMLRTFGDFERDWTWTVTPYSYAALCERNLAAYCSMFRREAWEQAGGYDETMTSYEDWNFWIALGKHGHRLAAVKEALLHYRVAEDGMFATNVHRELELIATIVRNHPEVYGEAALSFAGRILSGEDVDADLLNPPHRVFYWSRPAQALRARR